MRLTENDLLEHYNDMKKEPFLLETIKELYTFYHHFLTDTNCSDDKEACASGAAAFIYHDDEHLIEASEPDKVRIVMAVAVFMIDNGFSKEQLNEQIRKDLSWTLEEKKVKSFKNYYSKNDYKLMKRYIPLIRKWLKAEREGQGFEFCESYKEYMHLYDQIISAKKLIQIRMGVNTEQFEINLSSLNYGDKYYLLQSGEGYTLKYIDERGGTTFFCKNKPIDEARYHCYKLLVEFCSSEYFRQFKESFDRIKMFEKQLEYMSLIDNRYTERLQNEIAQILENRND